MTSSTMRKSRDDRNVRSSSRDHMRTLRARRRCGTAPFVTEHQVDRLAEMLVDRHHLKEWDSNDHAKITVALQCCIDKLIIATLGEDVTTNTPSGRRSMIAR